MHTRIESNRKAVTRGATWQLVRVLVLVLVVALAGLAQGLAEHPRAIAQNASLRVDPPDQSVAAGQTFIVTVVQSADFATLGAAATLQFDPGIVNVTGAEVGPTYADGLFLFGAGSGGAQSPEQALAEANTTGLLANITTLFLPGAGTVPPGEAVVATISMTGVGGGTSPLNLVPYAAPVAGTTGANTLGVAADPPDAHGNLVPVTVIPGQVTVAGGAGAGGATPPPAAATATPAPASSPTPAVLAARADPNASATVSVNAGSQTLTIGGEGKVELKLKANVTTSGAETDISFDKNIIQLTKVETGGGAWKKAELQAGASRQTMDQAIADANSKGELKSVGATILATASSGRSGGAAASGSATSSPSASRTPAPSATTAGSSPAGSRTVAPSSSAQAAGPDDAFLVLSVKGLKNGETELKLKNSKVLDGNNQPVKVTAQNGKIVVGEGDSGGGLGLLLPIAGVLVIGGLGGGGFFAYRAMKRRDAF